MSKAFFMIHEVVDRFYTSLAAGNGDDMAACYSDDVIFEDPAFGELRGEDARDMWRMLCERSSDLTVKHTVLESTETSAKVNWIATYTFSTGRPVRNDITATMQLTDGLIRDHRDNFDMWSWSRQALGVPGLILGWSPPMRKKVRSTARGNLERFQSKRA